MDGRVSDKKQKRRFLTIEQVAQQLNISVSQIRTLPKAGDLRGIQVGGRNIWRIAVADVEDYIIAAYTLTAERIAAGELPE